jgi:hypothetical protein
MTTTLDATRMTRAQRAALPLSTDIAQALAERHGVCIRPLAMRRIDTTTGRLDVVPCGSPATTNAPLRGQSPPVANDPLPRGPAPRGGTDHRAGHPE